MPYHELTFYTQICVSFVTCSSWNVRALDTFTNIFKKKSKKLKCHPYDSLFLRFCSPFTLKSPLLLNIHLQRLSHKACIKGPFVIISTTETHIGISPKHLVSDLLTPSISSIKFREICSAIPRPGYSSLHHFSTVNFWIFSRASRHKSCIDHILGKYHCLSSNLFDDKLRVLFCLKEVLVSSCHLAAFPSSHPFQYTYIPILHISAHSKTRASLVLISVCCYFLKGGKGIRDQL